MCKTCSVLVVFYLNVHSYYLGTWFSAVLFQGCGVRSGNSEFLSYSQVVLVTDHCSSEEQALPYNALLSNLLKMLIFPHSEFLVSDPTEAHSCPGWEDFRPHPILVVPYLIYLSRGSASSLLTPLAIIPSRQSPVFSPFSDLKNLIFSIWQSGTSFFQK